MVLEIATLNVREGQTREFESTFARAALLIASIPGYLSLELQRCLERPNRYALLVKWETLEAHTVGFRQSAAYEEWRSMMHPFFDPPVTVEHFQLVELQEIRG